MGSEGSTVGIDRKSSIESEPRTLTMDQIQYAREAALHVMKTRSIEEALRIFTEGLEPVGSGVPRRKEEATMDMSREMQCLGDHLQQLSEMRDIVSAPF